VLLHYIGKVNFLLLA